MVISLGVLAGIMFALFLVLVAFFIAVMLYRDLRSRQNAYANFASYLDEFLVIMTKDGHLHDVLPKFMDDPLYEQLVQNERFESILSISDLTRLNDYIRGLDAYPDIPFIFSFRGESGLLWYELRAVVQKNTNYLAYLIKNVTMDVESRNQRDSIQKNLDLLLQSTGDFLWSMDVERRQFSLLTPISDDEGRVVPRSVGVQDIHTVLPDVDFARFAKMINSRVVDFRTTGRDNDENRTLKVRLYGQDGKKVWYALRCKVGYDENARLAIKGTARRMDMSLENPMFDDQGINALASQVFALPDMSVFCLDRDYRFVSCNLTFAMEHSIPDPRLVIGKRTKDVITTKYLTYLTGLCSAAFETGRPVSWRGSIGESNRIIVLNTTPVSNDEGVVTNLIISYIYMSREEFDYCLNSSEEK